MSSSSMLSVTLRRAARRPRLPGPEDETVNVWRDSDGEIAAFGGTLESGHWMEIPRIASYLFEVDDPEVIAYPRPAVPDEPVLDGFRRVVLPMALQARGQEVIHASAVLGPDGVVALCAISETGKSTLAFGLSRRGYELWADDAVAFEIRAASVDASPLPFALRLRPASAAYFGVESEPIKLEEPKPATLAAVCVLERVGAGEGGVERMTSAAAFRSLLSHAYCFDLNEQERKRHMLKAYLMLTQRVPVFRIGVAAGLEHLPDLLDAIELSTFGVPPRR